MFLFSLFYCPIVYFYNNISSEITVQMLLREASVTGQQFLGRRIACLALGELLTLGQPSFYNSFKEPYGEYLLCIGSYHNQYGSSV